MFIMQKINPVVFPRPDQIMDNLLTVTEHIQQKNSSQVKLRFPEVILTTEQRTSYVDNDCQHWRIISFIENTVSIDIIENENDAIQTGAALGHFHRLLDDLLPERLNDTLPDFHITPRYVAHYQDLSSSANITGIARECAAFINEHRQLAFVLENAKQQRLLKIRTVHGDPKINNILFDRTSRKAVSLIDLDTVKPGLIHYDIGDCLRSCCNTAANDSLAASFDIGICETILTNYLAETREFFSENDHKFLYDAIILIPFELGLRFFIDYLENNYYFKVSFPEQNLIRARHQFQLVQSIEKQQQSIRKLLRKLAITN